MNIEQMEYGIVKYGTPLYVFDIDEMKKKVNYFRERLWHGAGTCFAMKANPFLVRQMASVTDRIEVCSRGEFEICKKLQIEPDKLLISGVLKKNEDFYDILNNYGGRCCYTLESVSQFHTLASWCEEHTESVSVYLRLSSGNQFGMDEETIENIISLRKIVPYMKIRGIHYFSGTQKKKETIEKELQYLDEFCLKLEKRTEFIIEELEYGSGISVAYFEGQKESLEEDIEIINRCVEKMKWKGHVIIEMGRAFVASCGYYLTSVREIKKNNEKNYCIVDGGIHQVHYDGQIRGIYQPEIMINPEHMEGKEEEYTICGSLCTVNDVLIQKIKLKGLKVGNILIFRNTGAYAVTEGMALFLSHELPQVAFYCKEMGWKLVREEQQTFEWNMERKICDESFDEYFKGN